MKYLNDFVFKYLYGVKKSNADATYDAIANKKQIII